MISFLKDARIPNESVSRCTTHVFTIAFAIMFIIMSLFVYDFENVQSNLFISLTIGVEAIILSLLSTRISNLWRSLPMIHLFIYRIATMIGDLNRAYASCDFFYWYWFFIILLSFISCLILLSIGLVKRNNLRCSLLLAATCVLVVLTFYDFCFGLDFLKYGYPNEHPLCEVFGNLFIQVSILLLSATDLIILNVKRILRMLTMIATSVLLYGLLLATFIKLSGREMNGVLLLLLTSTITLLTMSCGRIVRQRHQTLQTRLKHRSTIRFGKNVTDINRNRSNKDYLAQMGLQRNFVVEFSQRWIVFSYQYNQVVYFQEQLDQLREELLLSREIPDTVSQQQWYRRKLERLKDILGFLDIFFHFNTGFHSTSLDILDEVEGLEDSSISIR